MAGCELLLESLGLLGGNDELDFEDGEDTVQVVVVRETDDINNEDVEMMEVDQGTIKIFIFGTIRMIYFYFTAIMVVDGYPTVSFKRLTLSLQGTIDGVHNLLSSSPKLLIHPNQTQNLRVNFSNDTQLQNSKSREDLNKFFSQCYCVNWRMKLRQIFDRLMRHGDILLLTENLFKCHPIAVTCGKLFSSVNYKKVIYWTINKFLLILCYF